MGKCSAGQAYAFFHQRERWVFCALLEPSSPHDQFLFTPMRGDSKEKWPGFGRGGVWGWQLTLGSSELSSHGQNSEHMVLCDQLKLTLWIRRHVQLNYIM